jgi:phage N-6-adenine-methyltransferase
MVDAVLFSSEKTDWETPDDLFERLDAIYHFGLDAAANESNTKCNAYYNEAVNGLSDCAQWWRSGNVWLNPPYGRAIGKWVAKAYREGMKAGCTVVCLLPARTDTKWFREYCTKGTIYFLTGRLKFKGAASSAPFPSMIVVFDGSNSGVMRCHMMDASDTSD